MIPRFGSAATELLKRYRLLKATNRLAEAEPLQRRALEILEASLGPDHPLTVKARGNLAAMAPPPP